VRPLAKRRPILFEPQTCALIVGTAASHPYSETLALVDIRRDWLPTVPNSEIPFNRFAQPGFKCFLRFPAKLLADFPSVIAYRRSWPGRSATNVMSRSRGPTESGENSSIINAQIVRTTDMFDFSQLQPTL
jgi:hypothetical protein